MIGYNRNDRGAVPKSNLPFIGISTANERIHRRNGMIFSVKSSVGLQGNTLQTVAKVTLRGAIV